MAKGLPHYFAEKILSRDEYQVLVSVEVFLRPYQLSAIADIKLWKIPRLNNRFGSPLGNWYLTKNKKHCIWAASNDLIKRIFEN